MSLDNEKCCELHIEAQLDEITMHRLVFSSTKESSGDFDQVYSRGPHCIVRKLFEIGPQSRI
jgi:hypothetical protein